MTSRDTLRRMSDTDLVRASVEGIAFAFDELYARHWPALVTFFQSSRFDRARAEDLAQETFIRVSRHLATFRGDRAKFTTWLFTISTRLKINAYRDAERRRRVFIDESPEQLQVDLCAPVGPELALDESNLLSRFQWAVTQLPEKYRTAFLARLGPVRCRYDEIAVDQAVCVGTIKSRISRARMLLQQIIHSPEAHRAAYRSEHAA